MEGYYVSEDIMKEETRPACMKDYLEQDIFFVLSCWQQFIGTQVHMSIMSISFFFF